MIKEGHFKVGVRKMFWLAVRRPLGARWLSCIPASAGLRYSKSHEWVKVDANGTDAVVGITDYAQKSLGDLVYVELPEIGRKIAKNGSLSRSSHVQAS